MRGRQDRKITPRRPRPHEAGWGNVILIRDIDDMHRDIFWGCGEDCGRMGRAVYFTLKCGTYILGRAVINRTVQVTYHLCFHVHLNTFDVSCRLGNGYIWAGSYNRQVPNPHQSSQVSSTRLLQVSFACVIISSHTLKPSETPLPAAHAWTFRFVKSNHQAIRWLHRCCHREISCSITSRRSMLKEKTCLVRVKRLLRNRSMHAMK